MLAAGAVIAAIVAGATAAAAKPVVLDDGALYAAALTTADFPAGWQLVPPEAAAGAWVVDPIGGPCETPNPYGRAKALNVGGAVLVAFTPDPVSLPGYVYQDLYSFHTRDDARVFVQRDSTCTEWTWDDDGWTYTQEVTVDGPTTRVHWSGTSTPGAVEFDEVFAMIRMGNNVVTVGESRYDGTTASVNDVEHYAAIAADRLRNAIAGSRRAR